MTKHTKTLDRLQSLAAFALAEGKRLGASDCLVSVSADDTLQTSVRVGKVEELTSAQPTSFRFTAYLGTKSATVASSDIRRATIIDCVRKAIALARYSQEDPFNGLADAEHMAIAAALPNLSLLDNAVAEANADYGIALAIAAENAARSADKRIVNSEGATFYADSGCNVIGNSRGFLGGYLNGYAYVAVGCIAQEGEGLMQTGNWHTQSRVLANLESAESVGQTAAAKAIAKLGGRKVPSQVAPVVYSPEMAARLVSAVVGAASGSSIYRKTSFLLESLGKPIACPAVNIIDDALIPHGLGSAPFDQEGLPTSRRVIVGDGVLNTFLMGAYSARKLGKKPNSGRTNNLYLAAGTEDPQAIIRSVKNGLYLTHVMGRGFNPTTGDYSIGAGGMWIENGELAFPVEEITIAGKMQEMLMAIEAIGNDLEFRNSTNAPTIKIGSMTIAGS